MPLGQHWLPQVTKVPVKSVVNSGLVGCAVIFCWDRSQLIVEMALQSLPAGQQITDLSLLNV